MVPKWSGGSKTWRKLVSVTWVVGLDSNFFGGVFGLLTFFGESAAECEYAANSGHLTFFGKIC